MPIKNIFGSWGAPVVAKTANYTVKELDAGTVFTNRGAAGSVTFTLPVTSTQLNGWWIEIFGVAAQTIVVATNPTDTLVVFNDATADSWSLATAGAIIGSGCRIVCDGTGMLLFPMNGGTDAATPLVARNTLAT